MSRFTALLLVVALLAGCTVGQRPPAPWPTPAQAATRAPTPTTTPPATPTPVPTAPPSATPTPVPTAPPSATPSPMPTAGPATADGLKWGYSTLVLLEWSVNLLDETALHVRDGELERSEASRALAPAAMLLFSVEQTLAGPPPAAELAGAWESARAILASAQGTFARWLNGEIAEEVLQELATPKAQISQILDQAGALLAQECGMSPDELQRMRTEALAEFRTLMQPTATPAP